MHLKIIDNSVGKVKYIKGKKGREGHLGLFSLTEEKSVSRSNIMEYFSL
jgi:hypothetical protein